MSNRGIEHSVHDVTILVTVQCPDGSVHLQAAGTCFVVNYYKKTWKDALVSILLKCVQIVKLVLIIQSFSFDTRIYLASVAFAELSCFLATFHLFSLFFVLLNELMIFCLAYLFHLIFLLMIPLISRLTQ